MKTSNFLKSIAVAVSLASAFLGTCGNAWAAGPMVKVQAPGYYRMMLGDFEVTALSDGTVRLPVDKLLHQPAARTTVELERSFMEAPVETSVNAYLINTGAKLVMIDAGTGVLFGPTLGNLPANLQAAGYKPEQVDDIFITHMHPDHVGGLVSNGKAVFPNAVIHVDKRDADFWLSTQTKGRSEMETNFLQGAQLSLAPYIAAGKLSTFEGSAEITPGIKPWASPGHTPGHSSYLVESKGQTLAVLGDLIHVAAVQLGNPAVTIEFDADSKAAGTQRAAVFARAAKQGYWVGASHLSFPGLGHLHGQGRSFQWVPANYTTELK